MEHNGKTTQEYCDDLTGLNIVWLYKNVVEHIFGLFTCPFLSHLSNI